MRLIETLRGSSDGESGALAAVIFPPETVMATCTGPQRVIDDAPVQFPSASDFVPEGFVVDVDLGDEGTLALGAGSVVSVVARSSAAEPEDCEA